MNTTDFNPNTEQYLLRRGLVEETIKTLKTRWILATEALDLGFGRDAISSDGGILFPLSLEDDSQAILRNYYSSSESEKFHLKRINKARKDRGEKPAKKIPKYILPKGFDPNQGIYDPYALLHPNDDKPILFATEDVFGAIKAAQLGHRVISTFGVWLVTNDQLAEYRHDSGFEHPLKGKIPFFLADSDATSNVNVAQALIRTSLTLKCPVGFFPSIEGQKIGMDEYIDLDLSVEDLMGQAQ